MTPNGAALFIAAMVLGASLADEYGLTGLYVVLTLFSFMEVGVRSLAGLQRATLVVAPLATFMIIVWVVIVGRSPVEIGAGVEGSRSAALLYVTIVSARLFLVVFLIQAVAMRFDDRTPMNFVRTLNMPLAAKRLIALTLSLIETLRNSVDRSHTALVAAGVITRGISLHNIGSGWILVQTVWLTAITTVTARMRDKWPTENTLALLGPALDGAEKKLKARDIIWIALAVVAASLGYYLSWRHA